MSYVANWAHDIYLKMNESRGMQCEPLKIMVEIVIEKKLTQRDEKLRNLFEKNQNFMKISKGLL